MENKLKKVPVTIEVDPQMAVAVMGIVKGFLPSIFELLKEKMRQSSTPLHMSENFECECQTVIGEIYEKCIAQTTIREGAANLREVLEMTGQFPDEKIN